jgi:hypothetical protein
MNGRSRRWQAGLAVRNQHAKDESPGEQADRAEYLPTIE